MARYAQGVEEAFAQLYDRYEGPLYEFCVRQLGDRDAADDTFQEVMRRLVDARHTYEPRGRFAAWMFTIARRLCVDQLRERRRTVSIEALPDTVQPHDAAAAAVDDEIAVRDELQRLLARLPVEQREVVLLSKYHGFTYAEIAEIVGGTEVAAKQKTYRALKSLRAWVSAGAS